MDLQQRQPQPRQQWAALTIQHLVRGWQRQRFAEFITNEIEIFDDEGKSIGFVDADEMQWLSNPEYARQTLEEELSARNQDPAVLYVARRRCE